MLAALTVISPAPVIVPLFVKAPLRTTLAAPLVAANATEAGVCTKKVLASIAQFVIETVPVVKTMPVKPVPFIVVRPGPALRSVMLLERLKSLPENVSVPAGAIRVCAPLHSPGVAPEDVFVFEAMTASRSVHRPSLALVSEVLVMMVVPLASPVIAFDPLTAETPSVISVAMVKFPLKLEVGVNVTSANKVFTSAIGPVAVHTPVPAA